MHRVNQSRNFSVWCPLQFIRFYLVDVMFLFFNCQENKLKLRLFTLIHQIHRIGIRRHVDYYFQLRILESAKKEYIIISPNAHQLYLHSSREVEYSAPNVVCTSVLWITVCFLNGKAYVALLLRCAFKGKFYNILYLYSIN